MAVRLRSRISGWIGEIFKIDTTPSFLTQLSSTLEIRKNENELELHLPVIKARNLLQQKDNETTTLIKRIVDAKYDDRLIRNVAIENSSRVLNIVFTLHKDVFIKEILDDINHMNQNFILSPRNAEKVVVEFSSPNIAKPFHVGHLRSTIIGNFIAHLHKYLGNDVVKINYLGDWGTQYGLLKLGVEMIGLSDNDLQENPMQSLYTAYVTANQAASSNPSITKQARIIFNNLETNRDSDDKEKWEKYRKYTVDELKTIYNRLGVEFDEYAWESQYGQEQIYDVVRTLEDRGLLLDELDGRKIAQIGDRRVPVIKSDGSTLYLARDIAALLDRFQRYKFDKILYVVDNAQTDHFHACFHVASEIEPMLRNRTSHIKFGRIKGMSTRKGNVVFLKDVLDEARDIMLKKQIESPTTKIDIKNMDNSVADTLAVSAVIINDLKQRRQRDYNFDWDKALQVNGDTGIKLQYTHCRLCSLFEKAVFLPAETPEPKLLFEPEALSLITEMARFPEIIYRSEERLEACELVNYLFSLSNTTSRALKRLNVKNQESEELQQQRILLFTSAKKILADGMRILGLKPLEKM